MDRDEIIGAIITAVVGGYYMLKEKKPKPAESTAPEPPKQVDPLLPGEDPWTKINVLIEVINHVNQQRAEDKIEHEAARAEDRKKFQTNYQVVVDELNKERDDRAKIKEQVANERKERRELKNDLDKERKDRQDLDRRFTLVQNSLTEAMSKNTMLERDNVRLTEDNAELRKVNSELLRINEELRAVNQTVVEKNEQLQVELGALRQEMDRHMELIKEGLGGAGPPDIG